MKRFVLVTGAAGFIGSHLTQRLVSAGCPVIGLDNFDDYYPAVIKKENIASFRNDANFQLIEGDIRDTLLLKEIFSKQNIRAVVHLAARAGVRPSVENPLLYQEVNVRGTLNLLEVCRTAQIEKFIFASSSSVYGLNCSPPFNEEANVNNPLSPYAASKASAELFCRTFHYLHCMPVIILRLFTVYGPRQRPDLAVHRFTRQILYSQEVNVFGDGTAVRDYTYIDDVVDSFVSAMNYQGDSFQIFNIGGGCPVDINHLLQVIENVLHRKAIVKHSAPVSGDMPLTIADISKARAFLGYSPRVSLEEGVSRFVQWYLEKQEG